MYQMIGEILLYAVSLPLVGFQTIMGIDAMIDVFAQFAEYVRMK